MSEHDVEVREERGKEWGVCKDCGKVGPPPYLSGREWDDDCDAPSGEGDKYEVGSAGKGDFDFGPAAGGRYWRVKPADTPKDWGQSRQLQGRGATKMDAMADLANRLRLRLSDRHEEDDGE